MPRPTRTTTDPETGIEITTHWKEEPLSKNMINWRITSTVSQIKNDIAKNPVPHGVQLNLAGYSTGSVIIAQSALMLTNEGKTIDNLISISGGKSLAFRRRL